MVRQDADVYTQHSSTTSLKSSSSLLSQPLLSKDNPIQLAAISNYKLAQLTFSAPDWNSLRKTALIKNMAEVIYADTPPEWLDQMCRWQFFTPESLANMTQDGLEHIFAQYIQTIEAFKPINLNDDDDYDDIDDDDDDDDIWPDDEILTPDDIQLDLSNNMADTSTGMPVIMEYPLYAQRGASLSVDLLYQKELKPLPDRPTASSTPGSMDKDRRKSIVSRRNRLSWTSDTGLLPNSLVGHAWANELMTMFNMEFQVDTNLAVNTAPKLPELPFSSRHKQHKRRSCKSQRYSTDSFMNLIPAFEAFTLEEPERRMTSANRPRNLTFPPPPPTAPPPSIVSTRPRSTSQPIPIDTRRQSHLIPSPTRSSSLKHSKQHLHESTTPKHKSMDIFTGLANVFSGGSSDRTSLTKKKSIRRLAALITGSDVKSSNGINNDNKPRPSISSSSSSRSSIKRSSSNIYQAPSSATHTTTHPPTSHLSSTKKFPASPICTAPIPCMYLKPLPEIPSSPPADSTIKRRKSFTLVLPTPTDAPGLQRSKSVGYRPQRDSFKATVPNIDQTNEHKAPHPNSTILSTTQSTLLEPPKRYHLTDSTTVDNSASSSSPPPPQPKRSKSTLMRISSGLARRNPQGRRATTSSTGNTKETSFVTRMASLGKRMKLQRT
ncbi:hypothetical protein [Absidia glauca]|uniref:Uncharacterized protein n=1 Tax=Absidia glauca TaxID=4829 RepID=A0A168M903_ABSGL|nr:hypothetical protein [Absidia glauca]